jgi:hypothetical protein
MSAVTREERQRRRELYAEFRARGCIRCGEAEPGVIDAHHLDRTAKRFGVGSPPTWVSVADMEAELAKCIPVCSNCHIKQQMGLWHESELA